MILQSLLKVLFFTLFSPNLHQVCPIICSGFCSRIPPIVKTTDMGETSPYGLDPLEAYWGHRWIFLDHPGHRDGPTHIHAYVKCVYGLHSCALHCLTDPSILIFSPSLDRKLWKGLIQTRTNHGKQETNSLFSSMVLIYTSHHNYCLSKNKQEYQDQ